MLGYLEYFAVKSLGLIVRSFPQRAVVYIGGKIGGLVYLFDRKHRQVCLNNLKIAFGAEKNDSELRKLARRSFMNLTQSFFEVLLIPRFNAQLLDRFVSIEGRENLDLVRSQGRGGILLTAHFGNWELSAVWASLKGYSLNALAREQKQSRLNFLLNQYRRTSGLKVYTKGMAVRELIAGFRRNELVGILGDQDAGQRGVFVNFFGRPASTNPGPILLALRTGTPVLPCFIVRSGFRHKIYVNPPIDLKSEISTKASAKTVKDGLQKFSAILESYIRLHPEQWLWVHKRWKTQPKKPKNIAAEKINIMVLSDGKSGHLSQSMGIASGFFGAVIKEVKINFQNKLWKVLIPLLAGYLGNSRLIKFFLKKSLTGDSFKTLTSFSPQLIISSGSSLAAFNLLYGRITKAKKVVCMKPGILNLKFFDLIIAPGHDHLPIIKNVLNTFASPHRLKKEDFNFLSQNLRSKYNLKGNRFISFLIGGENPYFFIGKKTIKKTIGEIKKACETHKFNLLLTTSRRTPVYIEQEIKNGLGNFPNLKLFVSAREESFNPVGGMLGLSEVAVVTEDSISMIAEASGSGRKIIVLKIDRKSRRKNPRHLETINDLAQKGYVRLAEPQNLSQAINRIIMDEFKPKILNDTEKAVERVKELLE